MILFYFLFFCFIFYFFDVPFFVLENSVLRFIRLAHTFHMKGQSSKMENRWFDRNNLIVELYLS